MPHSNRQLNALETERVIAILDETVEKIKSLDRYLNFSLFY